MNNHDDMPMANETYPQPPAAPVQAKRCRKPKVIMNPRAPRRKSGTKRAEAHQRVLNLIAARGESDPVQRRTMTVSWVRTWIDRQILAIEPELQDLMWVQYRYMTPLERTEMFTREYIEAYRRAYARYCGSEEEAARKIPCESEFARNDVGDMNCLWKARAYADALGVPYDMYLDTVMDGKLGNGKWIEPPLPNQLYAPVDPARLRDRPTSAEVTERLYGADWDARFFADAYRGDPVQEAALALMRRDVYAAPDPAARLSVYLVDRRAITEGRAHVMFGDELVRAALVAAGRPDAPVPQDHPAFRPHCFGYPQWADTSPCLSCSSVRDCWQHTEQVRAALVATTGTDDPRKARRRAQSAARQRAWFERRKRKPVEDAGD